MAVIRVPVADLRREPKEIPASYAHHDLRESQLLFGEACRVVKKEGPWVQIEALEQLKHPNTPYAGWVQASEIDTDSKPETPTHVVCAPFAPVNKMTLSYGTLLHLEKETYDPKKIRPLPQSPNRAQLVKEAYLFLGAPYLWGGRALTVPQKIASVDCSGLINLLYRAQGITIPRDAHDQYLASKPTEDPQPGDLLYLAKEGSDRVSHVILKLNNTTYLESPETGKPVRLLTYGRHFWKERELYHFEGRPTPYKAYPRTFYSNLEQRF